MRRRKLTGLGPLGDGLGAGGVVAEPVDGPDADLEDGVRLEHLEDGLVLRRVQGALPGLQRGHLPDGQVVADGPADRGPGQVDAHGRHVPDEHLLGRPDPEVHVQGQGHGGPVRGGPRVQDRG